MLALCVDDEELMLSALVRAVEASPDITGTVRFTLCSEALAWALEHKPDIAFLDINMRGMGGMALAEKLRVAHPDLPIIFCTGYREYAVEAFELHVSGYIMKPVRPERVQEEIDAVRKKDPKSEKLFVQCFGNFEIFYRGEPLQFKRRKAKELFAYLVDRRGAAVTAKEICTALWEDEGDDQKNLMHLYKLFADLRETLEKIGMEKALVRGKTEYAVATGLLDCDYYRYLAGDPAAEKSFSGEYMVQYSWAEETAAGLY